MKLYARISLLLLAPVLFIQTARAQEIKIERLNGHQPIISAATFEEAGYPEADGRNINGPCLVKLPSWLKKSERVSPKARYYLYFAHHKGRYLRLAWAEKVTGPYHLVQDSPLYGTKENAVFHLDSETWPIGKTSIRGHVASPIVIVDDEHKEFKLYFHAPTRLNSTGKNIGQKTFFATSENGLDFKENVAECYLGDFYFSPFEKDGRWYAFANHGYFYQAPATGEACCTEAKDLEKALWKERRDFFDETIASYCRENEIEPLLSVRHLAQIEKDGRLHILFSCREDDPERIYHVSCDLKKGNFDTWKPGKMELVMKAEEEWEGSLLQSGKSRGGSAKKALNEVRDPFIYQEKDELYLLYCAGGEKGIGIARLIIR